MGSYVVQMLNLSMKALVQRDLNAAQHVVEMDDTADQMDLSIEQKCMRLLAMQQPMSRDLRVIGTALKIITDLERIGDFAVDVAKSARRLATEPYVETPEELIRMSRAVEWMVRECIHAYVEHDLDLVHQVVVRDDEVDDSYDLLFTQLLEQMERNPSCIRQATWLLHVARFLERVADHSVNVAERVCYVETGELKQLAKSHKSHQPNGDHSGGAGR